MARLHAQEANLLQHIATLRMVALGEAVLVAALVGALFWATKEHRLSLPPALDQGANLISNNIHPAEAFGFAALILEQIYLWRDDGQADFPANIQKLRFFLTNEHHAWLMDRYRKLSAQDELAGRRRRLELVSLYTDTAVETLGKNSWLATVEVRLTEELNNVKIKDGVLMRFEVPVVYRAFDKVKNPWGLLLDRPRTEPMRVPRQ